MNIKNNKLKNKMNIEDKFEELISGYYSSTLNENIQLYVETYALIKRKAGGVTDQLIRNTFLDLFCNNHDPYSNENELDNLIMLLINAAMEISKEKYGDLF